MNVIFHLPNKMLLPLYWVVLPLFFFMTNSCTNQNEEPLTVSIDLLSIQRQLGFMNTNGMRLQSNDSPANEPLLTLIVGPLIFEENIRIYDPTTQPITDAVEDALEKDIVQTINYMKLISLPTDSDSILLELPETFGKDFQIFAVATDQRIDTIDDFAEDDNEDGKIYLGFSTTSYNIDSISSSVNEAIVLRLRRLCVRVPYPKGCASYRKHKKVTVTAAVEILGVKVNENANYYQSNDTPAFPWVVRDIPKGDQISVDQAKSRLRDLVTEMENARITIDKLVVSTTHKANPTESATCRNLADTANVKNYETQCEIAEYPYLY